MPSPTCEFDGAVIVLIGSFNPRLVQPRWLGLKGLIPAAEADGAEIRLIHQQLCAFTVGNWLTVEVTPERFQASAEIAYAAPLRDVVQGLFGILEHTPFHQLGMNRNMHFRLPTGEDRMALGQTIAPPGPWEPMLVEPLMRSVTMEGKRPEALSKYVHVTVEPSTRISGTSGVFVAVNEHFQVDDEPEAPAKLLAVLAREWSASMEFSRVVAEHLLQVRPSP